MVGTIALVVVFTLTALAVVLYAAYCEAGEDLPCKKVRKRQATAAPRIEEMARKSGS